MGRIEGAWGVAGWFRVGSYSGDTGALEAARNWYAGSAFRAGPRDRADAATLLVILEVREQSGAALARAEGIETRDQAEQLAGAPIFISRTDFPQPAQGEYYWVDLIGLPVFNREQIQLGTVSSLIETGPNQVLVLEPGGRMIPFVAACVDLVDVAARRIVVDWQPDY